MPAGLLRRAIPVVVVAVVAALIVALGLGGDGSSRSQTTESGPGEAAARESMPDKSGGTKSAAGSADKRQSATRTTGSNEPDGRAFDSLEGFDPAEADEAAVRPRKAEAFRINRDALATELARAPSAKAAKQGAPLSTISVPDPDGGTAKFRIQETSVMEPALAARHPEIKTYAGVGITDPTATIRLDLTPLGFHASVREAAGARAWYVDPASNEPGTTTHLSYDRSSIPAPDRHFVEPELPEVAAAIGEQSAARAPGSAVQRRTYRLALVNDASYAADFPGRVLDAKVTLMERVGQIYNDDLAIRMILVDGTDKLNLSGTKGTRRNGLCGASACFAPQHLAGCSPSTLDRNEFVVGQIIGADRFDVGHLLLGKDGGGIAGLGVVGKSRKAAGCTGLSRPVGDPFAIDYVAHELGHQFGANHTFNGTAGNCSGFNRKAATSVEPGSGSSVMAYAGICDADDLQPHTDAYLSQRSIAEVTAFVGRAPARFRERQVVTLRGFNARGERFRLAYPGRGSVKIKLGKSGNYTRSGIAKAVKRLTGRRASVRGYDGARSPGNSGFTVTYASNADMKNLQVRKGSRGVRGLVRTIYNGGPGDNRGAVKGMDNHHPTVQAPADKTIPVQTPFTLTATGGDVNDDDLVYLWEQRNRGGSSGAPLRTNTKNTGPLFRVFGSAPGSERNEATGDSSRTFPDVGQILAANTNAEDGSCLDLPSNAELDCVSEFLPESTYGGTLDFRVTVRDVDPDAGGTAFEDVKLTLAPAAGPFLVTYEPDQALSGGNLETVTWDPANTNVATDDRPALATEVRISLSTDGGHTFDHVLEDETGNDTFPNNGSAAVVLPEVATSQARIKIEAVDNYFFDISDADFSISSLTVAPDAATAQYSDPLDETVVVTAESPTADGEELDPVLSGVDGLSLTEVEVSEAEARPGKSIWRVTGAVTQPPPGVHPATVTLAVPGSDGLVIEKTLNVTVTPEDATVEWTGPTEPIATTEPTVIVPLSTEMTADADGTPGEIGNAVVEFVDRNDADAVLCSAPVTEVAAGSGTATCDAVLASDPASNPYLIGTRVVGAYSRDDTLDDREVTVELVEALAPD